MKRCKEINLVFGSLLNEMIEKEKPGFDLEIKEVCAPYTDKDWEYHAVKDGETIYIMSTVDITYQEVQGYTYNEIAENFIGRAMRSYQSGEYKKEYFFSDFLANLVLLPVDPEEYPNLKENAYLIDPPWTDSFIKGAFQYEDKFGSKRIVTKEIAEELKKQSFEICVQGYKKKYGELYAEEAVRHPYVVEKARKYFDIKTFQVGTHKFRGEEFSFTGNAIHIGEEECQRIGYTPKKNEAVNELYLDNPMYSVCEALLFDDFLQETCRRMEEEFNLPGPYYILPLSGDTVFVHNFNVYNSQSNAIAEFLMADCMYGLDEDVLISTRVFEYNPKTNKIKEVQRPKHADAMFRQVSEALRPGEGEWWKDEKKWTRG